jgi:WD repeat-containing protein 76
VCDATRLNGVALHLEAATILSSAHTLSALSIISHPSSYLRLIYQNERLVSASSYPTSTRPTSTPLSLSEAEREANIARNRALLAQLDVTLDIPTKPAAKEKGKAKPAQPARKRVKREEQPALPTRQSTRLRRSAPDPNETPEKKRKREVSVFVLAYKWNASQAVCVQQEDELLRQKLEQERLEMEEAAREAKRPRHEALEMNMQLEDQEASEVMALTASLQVVTKTVHPRRVGDMESFVHDEETHDTAVEELKERLGGLKIVSMTKVAKERIYSAAYHPEPTKDLVFFGGLCLGRNSLCILTSMLDKHGGLSIWDARAPAEEANDDEDRTPQGDGEGGRAWKVQLHWPATSKSSISSIKFDPIDAHSVVYLSFYYSCGDLYSLLLGIYQLV